MIVALRAKAAGSGNVFCTSNTRDYCETGEADFTRHWTTEFFPCGFELYDQICLGRFTRLRTELKESIRDWESDQWQSRSMYEFGLQFDKR